MASQDDDDKSRGKDPEDEADPEDDREDEDEPIDPSDESPRVTRKELLAFLSKPATLSRARDIVRQKVKGDDVDDIVNQAVADALAKPDEKLPRRNSVQAWFDRICRRRVADRYRKKARRAKHEGPMPEAPAVVDEAGEPVEDPGDAVVDRDPPVEPHPIANDWRAEGWLLRRWMREQVASDPRDRETWAIMEELAEADDAERLSYKRLAEQHGMTEAQLYKRMERLREKYRRRYEEWRNGMVMALLKWGAAAVVAGVAIAWVLWKLLHPAPPAEIVPDPGFRPAPSASASAEPPFEPALPTQPAAPQSPKPQTPPKPPQ